MRARQASLLAWYARVRRDFPWRATRDPYRILVSEVMAQQTQIDRVVAYYERFIRAFPDEHALAQAPLEQVHRLWQGLGYPIRAARLQAACQAVLAAGGAWPDTPETLQQLPGIGPYTASAVACFAFARAVPLVDTNVARVYARRDGVPGERSALWAHAARQLPSADPIAWNNALMELGATVCTARSAQCQVCPWKRGCPSSGNPARLAETSAPLKAAAARVRYDVVLPRSRVRPVKVALALIHHEGLYLVARRPRWAHQGGLWELPGGKLEPGEDERACLRREIQEELGVELLAARPFVRVDHDYGDRVVSLRVFRASVYHPQRVQPLAAQELTWVSPQAFLRLPFPLANAPILARLRAYHKLQAPR